MARIEEWVRMFGSSNNEVKLRAAKAILLRAADAPLKVLVEILQTLSWEGLGALAWKALLQRKDVELVPIMIGLLESPDPFIREVACNVLGRFGDRVATPHLLRMIDDPHMPVRHAAGFGLAFLKDPSSLAELIIKYERHRDDNVNVLIALQSALQSLGETEP